MPMYNLIEYSNNYLKTESLWQYHRNEPFLDANTAVANNNNNLFKFKQKTTYKTAAGGTKDIEKMVPLKYLSNFWRTLDIPLINCEITLHLTWSDKCVLSNDSKVTTFTITDTKLYVAIVTVSTEDSAKLLQQLKSGSRTIFQPQK